MKVITIASSKGGVGKTTTAVSVASLLGIKEAALLADFDPQGQCSLWFGYDPRSGVYDWLVGNATLDNSTMAGRPESQMWLLPGDSRTKAVEKIYRDVTGVQFEELVKKVRSLGDFFSYVVIDTAPSGVLQEVALAAADDIIVPFRAETPGVDGAYGTLAMLKAMRHHARVTLLPVDFYSVGEQRRALGDFIASVGQKSVSDPIPHRIAVAEAVAEGKTIWEYKGRGIGNVRDAYRSLLFRLVGYDSYAQIVRSQLDHKREVVNGIKGRAHASGESPRNN